MKFRERIECLQEAWEYAELTTHRHLTTKEVREVEAMIDILNFIANEVENAE